MQQRLHLGLNQDMVDQTIKRRSNVDRVLFDDMTHSSSPDNSYDCIVAVEVLEHMDQDEFFVGEVHRVLKPGGLFLMTAPNGDFVANDGNPDHKSHCMREQLRRLLALVFPLADVEYAISKGLFHHMGMKSWSPLHPLTMVLSMLGNAINGMQSRHPTVRERAIQTQHLVALTRRK